MKRIDCILIFLISFMVGWVGYDIYRTNEQLMDGYKARHELDVIAFRINNNLGRITGHSFKFQDADWVPVALEKTNYLICVPVGDKNPTLGELWEIKLNGTSYDNSSYEFIKQVENEK